MRRRRLTLSPYTVGIVDTRMSMSSPWILSPILPSWGKRLSAMSMLAMTFMRDMIAAWKRLS